MSKRGSAKNLDPEPETLRASRRSSSAKRALLLRDEILRLHPHTADLYPAPGKEDPGHFFPNWPLLRSGSSYAADKSKPSQDEAGCNKKKIGHPRLTSGILCYFCPHGVAYGYQVFTFFLTCRFPMRIGSLKVMESPESVAFPFATIFTRYAKAPRTLVYDNSCHLHAYFLNREPRFIRKTFVVSDRCHCGNHTACNAGYDLRRYQLHPTLRTINSEAAEQANSRLVKLKASLSYMTPSNFHLHLRLSLASFNAAKNSGR